MQSPSDLHPADAAGDDIYRRIIESCPVPIYVTRTRDGRILVQSPALATLLGLPEGAGPLRVAEFECDPHERAAYVARLREAGTVDGHLMHLRRADGSEFVGALSGRLIDLDGEEAAVSSVTDISAQTRRESEYRQAHEWLEDAIEALDDGLVLYDDNDRLVMCNARYRAFHGETADLLVPGAYWPDVTRVRAERGFFVEAAGRMDEWLAGQIAQRGIAKREEFPSKDGRWFEYSHRRTRQGGFVSVWNEITERKEMERALRRSEEHFRSMVEGHPLPVWMIDLETSEILYESPAAAELFGRSWPSTQTIYSLDHFVSPAERAPLVAKLRQTGSLRDVEVRLRKRDGTEFWASLSDRLISYGGRDVSVLSIVDLTARRQADAESARQRELLHQGEKLSALGELLASVAHELNNPLSVLIGHALMLKETASDPSIAERAAKIGNAADRCARIVKTFLAMARQESGEMAPVDINVLVERALEFADYSLKTSGVDVRLRFDRSLPEVNANADQLIQVFTNLIVNAEQALNEIDGPRRLEIVTAPAQNGRQVTVTFRDNGPGVAEGVRSRIFEPLYTTKDPGAGTGLGLALSHRIVQAHGGSIELEDAPPPGATFTVRLFCNVATDAAARAPAGAESPEERPLSILIIDDEPDVGMLIADTFEFDGHAVEVTQSARRALELIKERDFDVIISDMRMPDMDGIAFYRALEQVKPSQIARLAFITGDALSSRVGDFLARTDCPYLEKPFMPADVRALVLRVIHRDE